MEIFYRVLRFSNSLISDANFLKKELQLPNAKYSVFGLSVSWSADSPCQVRSPGPRMDRIASGRVGVVGLYNLIIPCQHVWNRRMASAIIGFVAVFVWPNSVSFCGNYGVSKSNQSNVFLRGSGQVKIRRRVKCVCNNNYYRQLTPKT